MPHRCSSSDKAKCLIAPDYGNTAGAENFLRELQTDFKLVTPAAGNECTRQINKASFYSFTNIGRKIIPVRVEYKVFKFISGFVFHSDLSEQISCILQKHGVRQSST